MRENSGDLKIRERNVLGGDRNRSFRKDDLNEISKYSINLNNLKKKENK